MLIKESGQSLIELVVVIAMTVLIVTALTIAAIASLRNTDLAKSQVQATKLAQEGLERVRQARDMNGLIAGLGGPDPIISWDGNAAGNGALWDHDIRAACDDTASPPVYCFFKLQGPNGLKFISSSATFPYDLPTIEEIGNFQRAIILEDSSPTKKLVISVVQWRDYSGLHESRLSTYLGKRQ